MTTKELLNEFTDDALEAACCKWCRARKQVFAFAPADGYAYVIDAADTVKIRIHMPNSRDVLERAVEEFAAQDGVAARGFVNGHFPAE